MLERTKLEWGGLDILVNNAGILRDRSIAKMTLEEWQAVIDVNLSGVFHCCKYGLEIMRDGGSIVCIGSLAAKMGAHGQSNYAAAKAGVQALVRVLARECAKRSIRVNAVAPGAIDTAMMASVAEKAREHLNSAIALGRMGQPEEVAAAVLFLCSSLASYVTGHVLEVDGGFRG
jgi:3-oxoacyl-[acyl-carrier protein] reductase